MELQPVSDWHTKQYTFAECQECDYLKDGHDPKIKSRAIQHSRYYKHKMRIETTKVWYYEDKDKYETSQ